MGDRRVTYCLFDEIDIGIGGSAAEAVGQKLKTLARGQQILCITHLPQIAAFADQHFLIEKQEHSGRTKTGVRQLSKDQRRQEIARMMSGAQVTETSLKNARNAENQRKVTRNQVASATRCVPGNVGYANVPVGAENRRFRFRFRLVHSRTMKTFRLRSSTFSPHFWRDIDRLSSRRYRALHRNISSFA